MDSKAMGRNPRGQYTLEEGKQVCFDHMGFRRAIILQSTRQGVSRQELMENVAEQTGISFSVLKHWVQGYNAPSGLSKVQDIAKALHQNVDMLLCEKEDTVMKEQGTTMIRKPDSTSEKDIVRSLHEGMVDLIELFRSEHSEHDGERLLRDIFKALMKARLDIPREVFEELRSFVMNYLPQMVLADSLFMLVFSDDPDVNCLTMVDIVEELSNGMNMEELCNHPGFPISLSTWYRMDAESKDSQMAVEAIKKDFVDEVDNFSIVNNMENLINGAYVRLDEILCRYCAS